MIRSFQSMFNSLRAVGDCGLLVSGSVESALPILRTLCQKLPLPDEAFRALHIPQHRACDQGNATQLPRWTSRKVLEIFLSLASLRGLVLECGQDHECGGNLFQEKPKLL